MWWRPSYVVQKWLLNWIRAAELLRYMKALRDKVNNGVFAKYWEQIPPALLPFIGAPAVVKLKRPKFQTDIYDEWTNEKLDWICKIYQTSMLKKEIPIDSQLNNMALYPKLVWP